MDRQDANGDTDTFNRWLLNGLIVAAAYAAMAFGHAAPGGVVALILLTPVAYTTLKLPAPARRNWYIKMALVVGFWLILLADSIFA